MWRSGARCSWKMMVRAALRASTVAAGPTTHSDGATSGMTLGDGSVGESIGTLSMYVHGGEVGAGGGGRGCMLTQNSHRVSLLSFDWICTADPRRQTTDVS